MYGIDVSLVAMRQYRQLGKTHALAGVACCVMNAEQLAFSDGTFDLICGTAILHHLDMRNSFEELARTPKPTGAAIFLEPLGQKPFINLYRSLTFNSRTPGGHPLPTDDLEIASLFFTSVDIRYFHFISLLALAVNGTRIFPSVLAWFAEVDQRIFERSPALRKYALGCGPDSSEAGGLSEHSGSMSCTTG